MIASGAVRPSSAAQPWMCGQRRCPGCRPPSAAGVGEDHGGDGGVAVQEPAGEPGDLPGVLAAGGRAGGVRGVVAGHGVVGDGQGHGWSLPGGVMVRLPGLVLVRGGGCGRFPGLRPGTAGWRGTSRGAGRRRSGRGAALWPPVVGERQVVGFLHFGQVLFRCPRVRDRGRAGLAAGSGSGRFPAGAGHWPASLSAAVWGWPMVGYAVPGVGCLPGAVLEASAAQSIWVARWP